MTSVALELRSQHYKMLTQVLTLALASVASAQVFHKVELSNEKTPYDYVKHRLQTLSTDSQSGLPLSGSYEVEESQDYPDNFEGAASSILNTAVGVGGVGLGQGVGGIGLGGIGLGQGFGIGLGGVGGLGQIGVGGIGGGIGGAGGGIGGVGGGIGGVSGVGGIGVGGIGGLGVSGVGLGGNLLYHPILGAQVGAGYVDKKAYDAAQKKGADENIEKFEKKAEEESKHGQEGFQAGSAAAKAEKGESSFYKDEEAKKKAAGDEKFYEGGQKFDKHGEYFALILLYYLLLE